MTGKVVQIVWKRLMRLTNVWSLKEGDTLGWTNQSGLPFMTMSKTGLRRKPSRKNMVFLMIQNLKDLKQKLWMRMKRSK